MRLLGAFLILACLALVTAIGVQTRRAPTDPVMDAWREQQDERIRQRGGA